MRKLVSVAIVVLMCLMVSTAMAAEKKDEAQTVIGKVYLKAGAKVVAFVAFPGQVIPLMGQAFEDQVFYIIDKEELKEEEGGGIAYMTEGGTFIHNCPHHGKEEVPVMGIGFHSSDIGDLIKIEIFETKKK